MELDELKDELENLQMDGINIYFHLTGRENGDSINERGISLDSPKLTSTAVSLGESFFEDPEHYIDYETGNPQTRDKDLMVFIGCYDGDERLLIRKVGDGEYCLPSENIIGYLDIEDRFFKINPNNEFDMGFNNNL